LADAQQKDMIKEENKNQPDSETTEIKKTIENETKISNS